MTSLTCAVLASILSVHVVSCDDDEPDQSESDSRVIFRQSAKMLRSCDNDIVRMTEMNCVDC